MNSEGIGFGKAILFNEHFVVYGIPSIVSAIGKYTIAKINSSYKKGYILEDNRDATPGYKDGKLNGISKHYGEDGTLLAEENYENGKKNGMSKLYYEDGSLHMEVNYKDDLKDGVETTYLRWNNLKVVTLFEQGKSVTTKRYDEEQRLRDELIYMYGEQGSWVVRQVLYDEKGKVILDQEL